MNLCSISQTQMYLGSPTIADKNIGAQGPALAAPIQQDGEGGQGICIFNTLFHFPEILMWVFLGPL